MTPWIQTTSHHALGSRIIGPRRLRPAAFTLIELVVVMAIIVILIGLVLPSASALWANRKIADAETTIQGFLTTARARALRATGTQSGLLFFVAPDGRQEVVPIEQDPDHGGELAWQNVFRKAGEQARSLPAPMRVVPRYVVDPDTPSPTDDSRRFTEIELANESLPNPPVGQYNQPQRHRNFFTMIYSSSGQLIVGRDVLIFDEDADGDNLGDVTALPIGYDHMANRAVVTDYFTQDDSKAKLDPASAAPKAVPFLVVENSTTSLIALNFPSVDGLLLYDDSVFRDLPDPPSKRTYLLENSQPFYVSRFTGAVIRGPFGENS